MNGACILSSIFMLATAAAHSVVGERRIVVPLLRYPDGIATIPLARMVVRFAWHLTSVLIVLCAAAMVWPQSPAGLRSLVGATWLLAGVTDLIWSKGRHIGWPLISLAGASALAG